jgi:EPS-associated MarR family transcriptional regulator
LRVIEANPDYTQRQISEALGISLGAVNYCLRAMVDVGFVKAKNFRSSSNKLRYAYILTPQGAAEKLILTGAFLQRKMQEFEALKVEIDALKSDMSGGNVSTLAPRHVSMRHQNMNLLEN